VDYRKRRTEHAPILIDRAVVEQVESFNFLKTVLLVKGLVSKDFTVRSTPVVFGECDKLHFF
jgi:hypothetical protein